MFKDESQGQTQFDERERRTWAYVLPPKAFEVAGCECGNIDTQWSEFVGHCWCDRCNKDFVPVGNGLFDGAIPVKHAAMLGVTFDRVILEDGSLERFNLETCEYESATS